MLDTSTKGSLGTRRAPSYTVEQNVLAPRLSHMMIKAWQLNRLSVDGETMCMQPM